MQLVAEQEARLEAEQAAERERQLIERERIAELVKKQGGAIVLCREYRRRQQQGNACLKRHDLMLRRLIRAQTLWRRYHAQAKYRALKSATVRLQAWWRMYVLRRRFLKQRAALVLIQSFVRTKQDRFRYLRLLRAICKLQAMLKGKLQVKKYKIMKKKAADAKRDLLIEQRKRGLEMKKIRKAAVLKIENCRYRQLHRRECRLLRKYLARLPYEGRAVYFKYVELRKMTHLLVNDFVGYLAETHKVSLD